MADTLRNIGRGLARGMTADVLGTPVDTLNQVRGGLLGPATAGNPYATAIRGLLGPEQQMGTGDWFAQQMGLPQGQGVAYEAARMLAPSPTEILSAVRRAPSIQKIANNDAKNISEKKEYLEVSESGVIKGKADQIISELPGRNELNLWIEKGDDAIKAGWNSTGDPVVVLDKIVIDPDIRQQGYGRKVIKQAIQDAAEALPGGELKLLAEPLGGKDGIDLSDLVQFYESLGFDIDNYQEGMSGVPMSLRLPSKKQK